MKIQPVSPDASLFEIVHVLNESHGTVAEQFNFTIENNPSNNAFINPATLQNQLHSGIELFALSLKNRTIGCIAIEKSKSQADTFYIEKVSVIPQFRAQGYGKLLMDYATETIKEYGGKKVGIALIDAYTKLKDWYISQGFIETGKKDFEHLPFRVCFMSKQL